MGVREWASPVRPRPRGGIRLRATLIATVVVALALAAGGALMLFTLHQQNDSAMFRSTKRQAYQIATAIERGGVAGVDRDDVAPGAGVDVIQVLDSRGSVVVASPGAPSVPAVHVDQKPRTFRYVDHLRMPDGEDGFCASVVGAEHDGARFTVVALDHSGGIRSDEWITAIILLAEMPVLVAIAAVSVYLLVGRTLRPVSRITQQANAITSTALEHRVPVPDTHDEIHTLATTVNGMLSRLQHSQDAQLRFVGDASHELRSPLTTIVGILDLADDTDTAVDQTTVRQILLPEAQRMQHMVDDLLLLARADEDGMALRRSEVDLDDIVTAEVTRARRLDVAQVRAQVTPVRVVADPDKIGRALRNVIDNAARYADSTVTVSMSTTSDAALITVGDDGPGIPAEHREIVFDRFSRLEVDRRTQSGAGLGLAIVREIMRAHGGSVRIDTSNSGGAAVILTLPRLADDDAAVAAVDGQSSRSR